MRTTKTAACAHTLQSGGRSADLDEADDEAAQGGSGDVADAAEHGRGEGLEARLEAQREVDVAEVEPLHDPGDAGQRGADEERDRDGAVDVHAHQLGGFTILGRGAHRAPELGAADEHLQPDHERDRRDDDEEVDPADADPADVDACGRRDDLGRVDRRGPVDDLDDVLQDEGDADGRDQRREPRRIAKRTIGEALDGHADDAHDHAP